MIEVIRNTVEQDIPLEKITPFLNEDAAYAQRESTMIKEHPDWDDEAIYESIHFQTINSNCADCYFLI